MLIEGKCDCGKLTRLKCWKVISIVWNDKENLSTKRIVPSSGNYSKGIYSCNYYSYGCFSVIAVVAFVIAYLLLMLLFTFYRIHFSSLIVFPISARYLHNMVVIVDARFTVAKHFDDSVITHTAIINDIAALSTNITH